MDKEENCSHDCSACVLNCASRKINTQEELANENGTNSKIKKVIAVVSGKGGVGKSMVCSLLAVLFSRLNYKTAILDADITGPSIPKIFGVSGDIVGSDQGMTPLTTKTGIKVMSVNLLLKDEKTPVLWRGPAIAATIKRFWNDVAWGNIDYMFIDMPPGTGDVPLTVFQTIPLYGIIIVTSPQELVSMIVAKAVKMADKMKVPVLGIVENMSYVKCPDCDTKIKIFGESHIEDIAKEFNADALAQIPLDPALASLCDKGLIEQTDNHYLDEAVKKIETL